VSAVGTELRTICTINLYITPLV